MDRRFRLTIAHRILRTNRLVRRIAVFGLLLGAALAVNVALAASQVVEKNHLQLNSSKVLPMSDDGFWTIIASTTEFEADPERQISALRAALSALSPDEVAAFEAAFDHQLKRSYFWDLWGAAYVIHGGEGDDGFEYFRCWLISKGKEVFELALAHPDSLADKLAPNLGGPLEFEGFAYVARKVWAAKTEKQIDDMPGGVAEMIYPGVQPSGMKFQEEPAYLAHRYPKLWQRFGTTPLQ